MHHLQASAWVNLLGFCLLTHQCVDALSPDTGAALLLSLLLVRRCCFRCCLLPAACCCCCCCCRCYCCCCLLSRLSRGAEVCLAAAPPLDARAVRLTSVSEPGCASLSYEYRPSRLPGCTPGWCVGGLLLSSLALACTAVRCVMRDRLSRVRLLAQLRRSASPWSGHAGPCGQRASGQPSGIAISLYLYLVIRVCACACAAGARVGSERCTHHRVLRSCSAVGRT
jgi:hypothetical protein